MPELPFRDIPGVTGAHFQGFLDVCPEKGLRILQAVRKGHALIEPADIAVFTQRSLIGIGGITAGQNKSPKKSKEREKVSYAHRMEVKSFHPLRYNQKSNLENIFKFADFGVFTS